MHRAEVVRIDGTSYRAKEAEKRDAQRLAERAAKAATPRSQGWTMSIAPTPDPSRSQNTPAAAPTVPQHWTPEQALAAFECLQAMRQALCATYGTQVQQAWREQLVPDGPPPDFDPDEPF